MVVVGRYTHWQPFQWPSALLDELAGGQLDLVEKQVGVLLTETGEGKTGC